MTIEQSLQFLRSPTNILGIAVEVGLVEIVQVLIQQFLDMKNLRVSPDRNILQAAIELRQQEIVTVIRKSAADAMVLCSEEIDSYYCSTLHLAAKLPHRSKLSKVSGAALQFQREFQVLPSTSKSLTIQGLQICIYFTVITLQIL